MNSTIAYTLPALLLGLLLAPLVTGCGREVEVQPIGGPPVGAPPAPGSGAWGEPASGLVLRLEVPRSVYRSGDPMVFTVRARNDGADAILLPSFDDSMWHQAQGKVSQQR